MAVRGGEKLLAHLAMIQKNMAKGGVLRVGFLEGAMHPGEKEGDPAIPVAQVAAWNEFGDPKHGRPPRPFFRNMIAAKSPGWGRSMANILKNNGNDAANALQLMGTGIAGQLQRSINEFETPALAARTIAAKGFDKPLIKTADMLRGVGFEVKMES
jgi:hypothetical protein